MGDPFSGVLGMRSLSPRLWSLRGATVYPPVLARNPSNRKDLSRTVIFFFPFPLPPPTPDNLDSSPDLSYFSISSHPAQPPSFATRMGRLRTQRACATIPSMLSSARGAPGLLSAVPDAEVSAAAAGATGSEAARPGDRGGRNRGGRGAAATTSATGVDEGAEHGEDSPARKPDPEPGRMDHHQPGTGRYQVVSSCAPAPASCAARDPRLPPSVDQGVSFFRAKNCLIFFFLLHLSLWSLPLTPSRPFPLDPRLLLPPHPSPAPYIPL